MSTVKRIVCLANSRKKNGTCVAGKEIAKESSPAWIRPISARPNEEVSKSERQYRDGTEPSLLDVIDIPVLEHRPKGYQQENWLLDPQKHWENVSRLTWSDLERFEDLPGTLWINDYHTFHGLNDKVPLDLSRHIETSLALLHVDKLRLSISAPRRDFGDPTRRLQAQFHHAGNEYHLRVTDLVYEGYYLGRPDGDYNLGEAFLTVSLSEPFQGACYKLVAAIMERNRTS